MPTLSDMERRAIKEISSEKTRKMMEEAGIPSSYILSLYHETGRKNKLFDSALENALKNSEEVLNTIENVIKMTKKSEHGLGIR